MRTHKTNTQKERLVLLGILTQQFARLGGRLSIRMHKVTALSLYHYESISSNHRPFAVRIVLEGFPFA